MNKKDEIERGRDVGRWN